MRPANKSVCPPPNRSTAAHGEESPELAEYYFAYGDVLLLLVETNGDVFGGAAKEDPQAEQENTGALRRFYRPQAAAAWASVGA